EALRALGPLPEAVELLSAPGEMGADAARLAGLAAAAIGAIRAGATSAEDTRAAALALGIPAGVKIHSAVYAITPRAAGELAARVLRGQARRAREAEVMDLDEDE